MQRSTRNIDWTNWIILLVLSLTWGSSYILIKKSLISFSALQVASVRLSISALAFVPFLVMHYKRINWKKWPYLLVVGAAGSAIPSFFFAVAQTKLSSSMTGVLSSMTPLMTFIVSTLFFAYPIKKNKVLGVLIGLLGALILAWYGDGGKAPTNLWYAFLVMIATLGYAFSSNTVATKLTKMGAIDISASAFILIAPFSIFGLFYTNTFTTIVTHPQGWISLFYLAILSIMGTVIASIYYFKLVQRTSPVFASFVSYLIPIIALGWGLLDGETLTLLSLIGMVLILAGVYIAKEKRK